MADVSLDDLIIRTRLESGLRENAYYSSDQIIRYLDAGGAELADLFTNANQHYVISEFDFTTTGGAASAIVTLPDDFQQGHSLEIYPQTYNGVSTPNQQTRTIPYLSNWLNRNAASGNLYAMAPWIRDPVYTFLGSNLRFFPPQAVPAAPFKLYYTPKWTTLAAKKTVNFNIASGDSPSVPPPGGLAGTGAWLLANANPGPATDLPPTGGFDLILTFTSTNLGFSGTYNIVSIGLPPPLGGFGQPTFGASNLASAAGFTNPATGTGTYTYQPVGTTDTIPKVMAPWSEYLVVYAAIAINTDRQRGTSELERKLNALKVRVQSTIGQRQEEPQQPPLTRGAWNVGGGGWGGGGWGW